MGWLRMSRNEAEQVYRNKDRIEYACAICYIRMQKTFKRAEKAVEDFFTDLKRYWRDTEHD